MSAGRGPPFSHLQREKHVQEVNKVKWMHKEMFKTNCGGHLFDPSSSSHTNRRKTIIENKRDSTNTRMDQNTNHCKPQPYCISYSSNKQQIVNQHYTPNILSTTFTSSTTNPYSKQCSICSTSFHISSPTITLSGFKQNHGISVAFRHVSPYLWSCHSPIESPKVLWLWQPTIVS